MKMEDVGQPMKMEDVGQPMKMEPTEGSETSAIINQTPGNYPKENLLYSVHGESLKSRIKNHVGIKEIT